MFGKFKENTAGYEINTLNLPASWEYIYENRDVLLKVDQFGPVYVQAHPPGDIMLFKREQYFKFSPWFINITADSFEGRITNFFRPNNISVAAEPENLKIEFLPEAAVYSFDYAGLHFATEIIIPPKGVTVAMRFGVTNRSETPVELKVAPQLVPYGNEANMAPWDKYEWYLDTSCEQGAQLVFTSKLLNAEVTSKVRRAIKYVLPAEGLIARELSLEKYIGQGTIAEPEGRFTNNERIYGYPPVYAASYQWALAPGQSRKLTAVLTLDDLADAVALLDRAHFDAYRQARKESFDKLFNCNSINTGAVDLDTYAKYWLPLQMKWVAALDRGWPTGMRGSRDSAQDYAGLLLIDRDAPREIILTMCQCQRTDGWFPRQYSAKGKHGKHDLRTHVDGGAFFIEFMWQYLAYTADYELLAEKTQWLDTDEESTILEHLIRSAEYYLADKNIGEHGLCKVRGGDWLDAVNGAGLEGRGESVTVSAQMVMGLKYLSDILRKVDPAAEVDRYLDMAETFKENLNRHAYNKAGYYNGIFSDAGQWIFSDKDPDGEKRIYGVANFYAIIAGVADPEKTERILQNIETLKSDMGYRLFWPYLGKTPIEKVGRVASGDVPPCLIENGNVYNHGSQGFFARALAAAGRGDQLLDVLKWLLPYDDERHPPELTCTPPYAIVNCWQQLPAFHHRALFCFLTGSVAMAMRGVYEWMLGIKPTLDGLTIDPCLPKDMEQVEASFTYMGRLRNIRIEKQKVFVDGKELTEKAKDLITGKAVFVVK